MTIADNHYYENTSRDDRRDRREDPTVSIYMINDDAPRLHKMSCMYCKRTIYDAKGSIDYITNGPISSVDFGAVVDIQCKLCRQMYRLILGESYTGVDK